MIISANRMTEQVRAKTVSFVNNFMYVSLSDGREIRLSLGNIGWLDWLAGASPEQKSQWSLEPDGFAIYWEKLDDGIEVDHLLEMVSQDNSTDVVMEVFRSSLKEAA